MVLRGARDSLTLPGVLHCVPGYSRRMYHVFRNTYIAPSECGMDALSTPVAR